jgi:hypothetical protein
VAGGALAGVIVALISIPPAVNAALKSVSQEETITKMLGADGYQILGVAFFTFMAGFLFWIATRQQPPVKTEGA